MSDLVSKETQKGGADKDTNGIRQSEEQLFRNACVLINVECIYLSLV